MITYLFDSAEPIQQFALHPVLQLAAHQHGVYHLHDSLGQITLSLEGPYDTLLRHLAADGKPLLQQLLDAHQRLVVFLGREAFSA